MSKEYDKLSTDELNSLLKEQQEREKVLKKLKKIKSKGGNFSKAIILLVIVLNSTFAYRTFEVFEAIGNEPIALIAAWFGFTTGELWLLSTIKKQESKLEAEKEQCDEEVKEEYYYEQTNSDR